MQNVSASTVETTILGIDPGSVACGYGLIKAASNPVYIASGRISLPAVRPLHIRLKKLYDALMDIVKGYKPSEMVVERIFFAKNVKTALSLGQARGIVFLVAASADINVYEYSALEVKKAITGSGKAEKKQVQDMVMRILFPMSSLPEFVFNEDSVDALALAICHLNTIRFKRKVDVTINQN